MWHDVFHPQVKDDNISYHTVESLKPHIMQWNSQQIDILE